MANSYKNQRYILDTAGDTLLKAALTPGRGELVINGIRWVGSTTAGHLCVILDEDGVVLWESIASGANYVEKDSIEMYWPLDFSLPTLGSGVVYIYTGKKAKR